MIEPIKRIKINSILKGNDNETPLENLIQLSEFSKYAYSKGELDNNLRLLQEPFIRFAHSHYGGHGLTNLIVLAMQHDRWEFEHFINYLQVSLLSKSVTNEIVDIDLDNDKLQSNDALLKFNTTYFQTSLARSLFHAGRHHGSLVYGISGPRILISHPFQGITGDIYNMYDNTSDIVAALTIRGYYGRFHFLDYMSGLDIEFGGVPRWAIWFSIIAQHSDIVLFIKRHDGDFGESQKIEYSVVPNWVPKKIVEVGINEIQNARKPEVDSSTEKRYIDNNGKELSKEVWYEMQRKESDPFINIWIRSSIPKDRFVHMKLDNSIDEYPINYRIFK